MGMTNQKKVILHAPNVHSGGGKVLLDSVLIELVGLGRLKACLLDSRYVVPSELSSDLVYRFSPQVTDRLSAEIKLRNLSGDEDVILCFGNLPPLFRLRGHVKLFLQNKILLSSFPLENYSLYVKIRVFVERAWLRYRLSNVNEILVQSNSMRDDFLMEKTILDFKQITVRPFLPVEQIDAEPKRKLESEVISFIYVSSGEVHKNHSRLLRAWELLARESIFPELRLTLHPELDHLLLDQMEEIKRSSGANVVNLGRLSHLEIIEAYKRSSALIFPSFLESFGLPLYEAKNLGLPIIASEKDFVRDVLDPSETFDPMSARSMRDAVLRFLKVKTEKLEPINANQFSKMI